MGILQNKRTGLGSFLACSTTCQSDFDLLSAMHYVSDAGFREIDLLGIANWAPHVRPEPWLEDSAAAKRQLDSSLADYDLTLKALNLGLDSEWYDRSPVAVAKRKRDLMAYAGMMHAYQIPVAALQPGKDFQGEASILNDYIESLNEVLEIGRAADVTFALELHVGSPVGLLEDALAVLDALPDLRIIYDPSHFAMQEIPFSETVSLIERTSHLHIRDAAPGKLQVPYGQGTVDFPQLYQALVDAGYRSGFSIEALMTDQWDLADDLVRARADLEVFYRF